MGAALRLGELRIDVVRKDIRNVHLSVHPPNGRTRIAAPRHLSDAAVRAFAIGKLGWIRKQRRKLQEQERETPREYLDRETHFVWGRRCLLRVVEHEAPPVVEWRQHRLTLFVRPNTPRERRAEILKAWYRAQLRAAAEPLVELWQKRLDVRLTSVFVRRMRTRWGSCNPTAGTIRLNTDLAKKPADCPRIHHPARAGALDRTDPQRPIRGRDGSVPSRMGSSTGAAQSPARAARRLGILRRLELGRVHQSRRYSNCLGETRRCPVN